MDAITYALSKKYTDSKVTQSTGLHREIVNSLPSTGDNSTIYMVLDPNASSPDVYDEWLWVNGAYEHIGSTRVDLTDYYNKTQIDTALSDKANIATSLSGYGITDAYTKTEVDTALSGKISSSEKGVSNGVAELDANGKIPSSQLPSYVDDTIEGYLYEGKWYSDSSHTHEVAGETEKIYVELSTNKTYRWSGSVFVEISESLALGETSSTAYRGDRGKEAYDHSQSDHSEVTPTFTEASTRANIATGESIATIFGKIKKFFTDLKTVAFSGSYNDLSDTPDLSLKADKTDVDSVYSVMGKNGAKNLIPYPYSNKSGYSNQGMTTTYDADGVFTINKVAGTATAYYKIASINFLKPNTKYKLVFEVANATSINIFVQKPTSGDYVTITNKSSGIFEAEFETNAEIQPDNRSIGLWCSVSDTETNATVKVMLVYASDTDNTYQPYAKTNKQLTDGKAELESVRDYVNELGVKNLIPCPYDYSSRSSLAGINYTINADGSITMNGTTTGRTNYWLYDHGKGFMNLKSGDYILSKIGRTDFGLIVAFYKGSTWVKQVTATENDMTVSIDVNSNEYDNIGIAVSFGNAGITVENVTVYPMLRLASDINDDTYVQYAKTNKELTNDIDDVYKTMGEMGAKNLIPYPYANSSITDHDVTFTVNNDGTVIANGTANGTAQLYLVLGNLSLSDPGNLVINTNKPLFLSGCPSGGGNNTYRIQYGLTDGTTYWAKTASDTGSGVELTPVDGLNSYCFVVIKIMVFGGCTVNNLTFKPMLRLASDTDNTYQPYAMTNKQLTEKKADSATTLSGYGITDAYTKSEVDATISALGGNEIIDDIDISSYDSSSNKYTCPSDGYIQMQIGPGEKGEACVDGYPLLWVRENEGSLAVFPSLYVKKGTKVNLVRSATSSGVAFTFYKLGYDS